VTRQGFGSPLSSSQLALQGRSKFEMTLPQLHDWLDACRTMEEWSNAPAAKKAWTRARLETEREIARRGTAK
jgi:hypothetical protein